MSYDLLFYVGIVIVTFSVLGVILGALTNFVVYLRNKHSD